MIFHLRCCLFDFKQILEKPGLPDLLILVEVKIEKVVLPSYVKVSRVTATSFQLPKEVCNDNDNDKALKNFFASILLSMFKP